MEKNRKPAIGENLIRTLNDVVDVDYFATQKLIREIFISGYDSKKYDLEILQAYSWLRTSSKDVSVLANPHLPDYVKNNRFTVGLFMELKDEVTNNVLFNPVAFGLSSSGLRDDIQEIKDSEWFKTKGRVLLTDPDMLSFVVFTKYWHTLNSRAKILQ